MIVKKEKSIMDFQLLNVGNYQKSKLGISIIYMYQSQLSSSISKHRIQ